MCEPQLRTPWICRRSLHAETEMRVSSSDGGSRLGQPVHQEVAFLEVGQQLAARASARPSSPTSSMTPAVTRAGSGRRISPSEHEPVAALEARASPGTPGRTSLPRESNDQAQRRGHRQRHDHRHQHSQPVGEDERPEEGARQALEEEHRHHRHDIDDRRVGDRLCGPRPRPPSTIAEGGLRRCPAARAWRNRRTMFSTSMMASSTTTPTATTRPASTITFTVCPGHIAARAVRRPGTAGWRSG